jgi:hypothetical protein
MFGAEINPSLNYPMFEPNNNTTTNNYNTHCSGKSSVALKGMQIESSNVSKLYFGKENIKRIQTMLKKAVYKETDKKFILETDQDENDLLIAMRAVYLTHASHLQNAVIRQVKILNAHTMDYIVPDLISNIRQHYGYLKEINEPIKPIPRPINVGKAGRKTLPSVTTIFWDQ